MAVADAPAAAPQKTAMEHSFTKTEEEGRGDASFIVEKTREER
jgi:hypothetical protein